MGSDVYYVIKRDKTTGKIIYEETVAYAELDTVLDEINDQNEKLEQEGESELYEFDYGTLYVKDRCFD